MSIFFTADSHFSLKDKSGVIERDYRPFKSTGQMNRTIIKLWNKQAKSGDVIYHLGDFVNYNLVDKETYEKCLAFVKKINAKVILVLGNNESRIVKYEYDGDFAKFRQHLLELGFYDVIQKGLDLKVNDQEYYLTHCPVDAKENKINLFGHIHKCGFIKKCGFNVGVDNHYFRLFTLSEIEELVSRIPIFDENVYC